MQPCNTTQSNRAKLLWKIVIYCQFLAHFPLSTNYKNRLKNEATLLYKHVEVLYMYCTCIITTIAKNCKISVGSLDLYIRNSEKFSFNFKCVNLQKLLLIVFSSYKVTSEINSSGLFPKKKNQAVKKWNVCFPAGLAPKIHKQYW